MSRALDDVLVVDLTSEFWASISAALMGDFGARVIRVEDLSFTPPRPDRDGMHPREAWDAHAELAQRNKESLAIDLATPEGREIFEKLLAKADVFITDRPFRWLEEKGWDYDALCRLRADIVLARGSGFGPQGPDRDLPALDELAASRAGLMPTLGQPGEPPVYAGTGQMHTAVMLAFGIMVALHHREETGEGQIVDASLYGGNMYAASLDMQAWLAVRADRILHPISRLDAGNPMSGPMYPSSDGRWVSLAMPDTDRWWPIFSKIMGLDEDDPRFDTHEKRCGENRLEMMRVLDELFAQKPGSHWQQQFDEHKVSSDVIETYDYPTTDPQATVNRYILDLDHPSYGKIQSLGFPIYMSESPARLHRMAPCRGQHTGEILQETLGYSDARVEDLEAAGVAGPRAVGRGD